MPSRRPVFVVLDYAVALAAVALAAAVRLGLDRVLGDAAPFVTFLLVVVAAGFRRTGPAVAALLAGGLAGAYLFVPPRLTLAVTDPAGWTAVGPYLFAGGAVVVMSRAMRAARARAETLLEESVRREKNVHQHQQLLQATLIGVGDGLVATDAAGRVTFLNPVAERLTGWPLADAVGRPLEEVFRIVNEATREPVDNPALRALRDGQIVGLANHTVLIARDGAERPIDDSAAPVRDAGGAIVGAVLVFRDVTERKRAEAERDRLTRQVEADRDRLEYAADAAGVGFWYCDLPFDVLRWDDRVKAHFWLPPDAAVTIGTFYDRIHPGDREPTRAAIDRAIGTRGRYAVEYRTVDPGSGAVKWVRALGGAAYGPGGEPVRFDGVTVDVTDRRRAEAKAADARHRADAALLAAEVGTYYWDVAADRVTGDRNFVAIFGVVPAEGAAAPLADFVAAIHPDDRDRVGGRIRHTLDTDAPFAAEYRVAHPAGERWVLARGVVERDAAGAAVGWAGAVVDITDRKAAEAERERLLAEVEAERRLLDAVFDALPVGVAVADPGGRLLRMNRANRELWGNPPPADSVAEYRPWVGYWADSGRRIEPGEWALARVLEANAPVSGDHVEIVRFDDGRRRDVLITGAPVRDAGGRLVGGVIAQLDVTDQKAAVDRQREAERQFRTLFESMNEGYCVAELIPDPAGGWADFRYLLANPAFERLTGMNDFVGRTVREVLPGYEQHIIDTYGRVVEAGAPARFTTPVAGLGRWYDVSAFRIGAAADRRVGVLFADVTARHQAEESVRASARQLAEVFRHAPSFMGVLRGPDHVFELVNDRYDRLVGGRPLVGKPVREALPEVVGQGYVDLLDRVYRTGEEFAATGARVAFAAAGDRPAGERVVDFVYQPLRDPEGAVTGILVQGIDQTDRARAEEGLRASEEQFRTLFESMDEGYCIIEIISDPAGRPADFRYAVANPAFATHTGMTGVVGRTVREMLPNYESHLVDTYARVAETGEPLRFVDRVGDLDRWFDLSAFRVGGPGSRRVAVLFADITARKRAEDDRRRLASIVENSSDFIGIADPDGSPVFVNPAGRRLVGLPQDADVARTALPDYFVPEQRAFVAETVLPAVLAGGRWSGALTFRDFGTGAAIPVLFDLFRVDDAATGRPANLATVARDISELKRASALAREADERLRLVLGATSDYAVIVTDPAGRVTDWLGGAEAITGFGRDEAVGQHLDLIFTPEDRATGVPERELTRAAAGGRAEDKRWHRRRDGGEFYADGVVVPVRGEDHGLRGFAKVFRDATARKRAEDGVRFLADASASLAELVDYESTLRRIANLAVGGFADWCAVDVLDDAGGRRRLAVTAAEAVAVAAARAADAAFRPGEEAAGIIPHVLRSGEPEYVTDLAAVDPATAPQGPDRVAALRALGVGSYLAVPLVSRGRVVGGVTFLGTSARRRFGPDELAVAADLADRVAVAIENARLYQAIQEQDRRKDEFLATLAHELRNPLSPIRTGIEVLRRTSADAAAGRTLGMMDRQLGQLIHLVDDLMDVSRVSRGKVALRPEQVDLRAVAETAAEAARRLVDAAGHELAVDLPADPVEVDGDRTRLIQVVTNLLNNAAKYTPDRGRVAVSVGRAGADGVVRVADTGVGIPADMLPRVFDLFAQVGASLDRSQGGLGIGLTLVRRLVELHGGSVAAESPGPGLGSTFTVRLPLARAADRPTPPTAGPAALPATGPLRVLVVDDNEDAADSLSMLLEMAGHAVRTAHDGPGALRALECDDRPDLILLDLGLPGMSGYEVARRIRESPALRGVALAALTGWGQEEDRRRTKHAGFDYHLVKPADTAEVGRVLAAVAGARHADGGRGDAAPPGSR